MNTTTCYHLRIRYFNSPCLHRAVVEVERSGEVNSFIGGGRNNQIQTVSNDSAIVGGEINLLAGGDQRYSFIGGGINNIIRSECSSIIGGQNNTIPVNMANSHIIGSGITAVAANTLHVNCLNACDTPATATGFPFGTIFHHTGGTPPTNSFPLYIQL